MRTSRRDRGGARATEKERENTERERERRRGAERGSRDGDVGRSEKIGKATETEGNGEVSPLAAPRAAHAV